MSTPAATNLDAIFDELVHLGDELADIARVQRDRQAARLATTVVTITSEVAEVRERLAVLVGTVGEARN